jgi:hypothetical protein
MRISNKRPAEKQSVADLPPLNWRTVVVCPATYGGQFVARRYGIDPGLADTIAALAGLGEVRS